MSCVAGVCLEGVWVPGDSSQVDCVCRIQRASQTGRRPTDVKEKYMWTFVYIRCLYQNILEKFFAVICHKHPCCVNFRRRMKRQLLGRNHTLAQQLTNICLGTMFVSSLCEKFPQQEGVPVLQCQCRWHLHDGLVVWSPPTGGRRPRWARPCADGRLSPPDNKIRLPPCHGDIARKLTTKFPFLKTTESSCSGDWDSNECAQNVSECIKSWFEGTTEQAFARPSEWASLYYKAATIFATISHPAIFCTLFFPSDEEIFSNKVPQFEMTLINKKIRTSVKKIV